MWVCIWGLVFGLLEGYLSLPVLGLSVGNMSEVKVSLLYPMLSLLHILMGKGEYFDEQ